MSYFHFEASKETNRTLVKTMHNNVSIGNIQWFTGLGKYVFVPYHPIIYDAIALKQLLDEIQLMEAERQ